LAYNGQENADDALDGFFSTTNFTNLAGQLHERWGEEAKQTGPDSADDMQPQVETKQQSKCSGAQNFTMDNPYIVALQRRRDALFRTNEGWAKWADDDYVEATETIASQLAQKQDGVSMLDVKLEAAKEQEYCALPGIFCSGNCGVTMRRFELVDIEVAQTPRVHRYDVLNSRDEMDPPWLVEATSRASRLDPEDQNERPEMGFVEFMEPSEEICGEIAAAIRQSTFEIDDTKADQETTATCELECSSNGNNDVSDSEDADANFLAHLLLSSEEFRLPSDDEEDTTMAVPQNIASALVRRDGSIV
jgi:hypothetical protein